MPISSQNFPTVVLQNSPKKPFLGERHFKKKFKQRVPETCRIVLANIENWLLLWKLKDKSNVDHLSVSSRTKLFRPFVSFLRCWKIFRGVFLSFIYKIPTTQKRNKNPFGLNLSKRVIIERHGWLKAQCKILAPIVSKLNSFLLKSYLGPFFK